MILVICGFFVVLYLRGNYKTNILTFFKEMVFWGGRGGDSLSGSVPGRNTRLPQEILQNLISPQWNLPINLFKDPKHLLDTCFNGLSKKSSHTKPYLSPLSVILVRKIPTTQFIQASRTQAEYKLVSPYGLGPNKANTKQTGNPSCRPTQQHVLGICIIIQELIGLHCSQEQIINQAKPKLEDLRQKKKITKTVVPLYMASLVTTCD